MTLSLSHSKFVGKLFIDVAKSMDQLTGEYTRSCTFIEFGLQEHVTAIPVAIGAGGQELYSSKTRALFASVYDRLSRYPILLKETERYYEVGSQMHSSVHFRIENKALFDPGMSFVGSTPW